MDNHRPSIHSTMMGVATLMSLRSTCSTRHRVGCVLVNNRNQIIATGYNGSPRGFPHCDDVGCVLDADGHCLTSIHAEMNAIIQCAIVGTQAAGSVCYTTIIPCSRCAVALIQAGIIRVVYMDDYHDIKQMNASLVTLKLGGVEVLKYAEIPDA